MANREAMKETAYAINVVNMMQEAITNAGNFIATLSEKLTSDEGVSGEEISEACNEALGHLINGREFADMYGRNVAKYTEEFAKEDPEGFTAVHKELINDPRIVEMQDALNMTPELRAQMIAETEANIAEKVGK